MDSQLVDLVMACIYNEDTFEVVNMKLNIQKWGNSAAIRLPAAMLVQIGAAIGDAVEVDPEAFRVAKPKYKLADLLVQCNKSAPPPADQALWDSMPPVGAEVL